MFDKLDALPFKNLEPLAGRIWQDPSWSAIDRYSLVGRPAVAGLHHILGAPPQSRCKQIPSCSDVLSFSSRTQMKALGPSSASFDHSFVGFLYELDRCLGRLLPHHDRRR